jgi:hypothetical protein
MRWEGVDQTCLAQNGEQWWAVVYTVMNIRILYTAGDFLSGWATIDFSTRTLLHGVS